MIVLVFAVGLVAGAVATLLVFWRRWHAIVALCAALLAGAALTALIVHQATEADGIAPTRYDTVVIAIGAELGALGAALFLTCIRWIRRQVEEARGLEGGERWMAKST